MQGHAGRVLLIPILQDKSYKPVVDRVKPRCLDIAMNDSNTGPYALIHVHVCVHRGSVFRREIFEGRALRSGIFLCRKWLDTR
jgi:hypothetical protein